MLRPKSSQPDTSSSSMSSVTCRRNNGAQLNINMMATSPSVPVSVDVKNSDSVHIRFVFYFTSFRNW